MGERGDDKKEEDEWDGLYLIRLFIKSGLKPTDLSELGNLDLWQFYGLVKILKQEHKQELKKEYRSRKMMELSYLLATAWGLEEKPDEFFKEEMEIEKLYEEIEEKDEGLKKPSERNRDPLEGKGKYIKNKSGEDVWVYTDFNEILKFKNALDKINKR